MNSEDKRPYIVEDYKDYSPSFNAFKIVKTLLEYVPSKYTKGLEEIVLINSSALNRKGRRVKSISRNKRVPLHQALGYYNQQWHGSPANIVLLVDNIEKQWSAKALRIPVFRTMFVGDTLYHEIGHHIHYTVRPEHREREDIADEWANKLNKKFVRRRYWYIYPLLFLLGKSFNVGRRIHKRFSKANNKGHNT